MRLRVLYRVHPDDTCARVAAGALRRAGGETGARSRLPSRPVARLSPLLKQESRASTVYSPRCGVALIALAEGVRESARKIMPASSRASTPRSYMCDCACLSGEALRVRHANTAVISAASLLAELHHIVHLNASSVGGCSACPAFTQFRGLFLDGGSRRRAARLRALERVAQHHYRRHPCISAGRSRLVAPLVPPHVCIGVHAWRIMRVTSLMSDLVALSACQSDGVRRARAIIKRCRATAAPSGNATADASAASAAASSASFAHFQLYHAAVRRGKSYDGGSYWALALDDPPLSECDLALSDLAPSLKRYHSGVLGENAGAIALGLSAHCLRLPPWLSVASWKQDQRGKAPLPCRNLTAVPFDAVPTPRTEACVERPSATSGHAAGRQCGSGGTGVRGSGDDPRDDAPTAFLYSHWNPHYPRQDIRPAWDALYREELNASFSAAELKHLARIGSTGLRPDTLAATRQQFSGATHPCCSYFVARQASFRALGKLHALLLARVYLQEAGVDAGAGATAGVGDGLGGLEALLEAATVARGADASPTAATRNGPAERVVPLAGGDGSSKQGTVGVGRPWWSERAFAWARPDWAQLDPPRGDRGWR